MVEREVSPIRDEYAPVIFAQETLSYLESIDMMSGEVNNNTFEPL
jgi:histidine kinase 2/3/4 (cytokinin receptor)